MFSHFFIDRPVFACVISLLFIIGGTAAYFVLPVELFPDITPPTVTVSAYYSGASAETVAATVTAPIEKAINGVEGMLYMSSSSTSDGAMNITVAFQSGTNPDTATVLVQNRVNSILATLPLSVKIGSGVTVRKQAANMLSMLVFYSPDEKENDTQYLANFVKINVQDQLLRVDGVGSVLVFNAMDFSMRIWLNPDLMAARQTAVNDIVNALNAQNIQVASGRLGSAPVPSGTPFNMPLLTFGQLKDVKQFENIVLRTEKDGTELHLKDVAVIELGSLSYQNASHFNGKNAVAAAVYQMPGANALEVSKNVNRLLKDMKENQGLFGSSIAVVPAFDAAEFIEVSLNDLKRTLLECVIIVIAVVFMFLQSWRAAIIPILTVPVSLVGCFLIMWMFGFTINTLTLFGLILAIGIVVDDSIVVIENTQRIIDEEHLTSYDAARKAMLEVTGPVIATTLVLLAVFIPVSMMSGITGGIYRQLALTIAGSVAISAVCALTLAPAIAAVLLKPSSEKKKRWFGFRIFNFFFDGYANFYGKTIHWFIRHRIGILAVWILLTGAIVAVFKFFPMGGIPSEDQGMLYCAVQLPNGATLERTQKVAAALQKQFADDNEGIQDVTFIEGFSIFDGATTNAAFAIITLKPWAERYTTSKKLTSKELADKWHKRLNENLDAKILVVPPPAPGGGGVVGGLEFQILDRTGRGSDELYKVTQKVVDQMRSTGKFIIVNSTFSPYAPRYSLEVDKERLLRTGASTGDLAAALSGYYGAMFVNNFTLFDNNFTVNLQAAGEFRTKPDDVLNAEFRHPSGQMIPIRTVAEIKETAGPQVLNRYQLFTSSYVQSMPQMTVSSAEAMQQIKQIMDGHPQFGFMWSGMTYQESLIGSTATVLFIMSIIFAFLVLCAQYESWTMPVVILMAVPLGIAGSLIAAIFMSHGVNLYTQMGFILMVGLSAKNAILIAEFAAEEYRKGKSGIDAAIYAGKKRLRPIMMTSFAFIIGVIPLVLATGAGAASRNAVGSPVCGGMLTETLLGVYVTPVLVVLWTQCFARKKAVKSDIQETLPSL